MNPTQLNDLRAPLQALIDQTYASGRGRPAKYWYPLSLPTFGVEEILQAIESMTGLHTSMGPKTLKFETAFNAFQQSRYSVMVNSGSSADLLMAFLLVDHHNRRLNPGDEVLIPAVTWPTQIWSPMMAGLKVTLVDVDPTTLNVDIDDLKRKITARTRAFFAVHLMGNPCDMHAIDALVRKHNLVLLEDCCEALGSQFAGRNVGNFGLAGSFSFFFAHHMCTMEGGMVCTQDEQARDILRMLRAHGWVRNLESAGQRLAGYDVDPRYAFVDWGFNVRPTEPQAGFGIEQIRKLPGFNQRRDVLANRFFQALQKWRGLSGPRVHPEGRPAWFTLPVMVAPDAGYTRAELTAYLESQGVETRPIVVGNIARHPVAAVFPDLNCAGLVGADKVHQFGFYIGLSAMTTDAEMDRLIQTFDGFFRGR